MMKPSEAKAAVAAYSAQLSLYEAFAKKLAALLSDLLKGFRIDSIQQRAKEADSLFEKLVRPENHYHNGLADIHDLCGVRVVVFTRRDVDRVCKAISQDLEIDEANWSDGGRTLKPYEFGYRSNHLVFQLGEKRAGLPEWRDFANLKAEIQVRTVVQHAWAALFHRVGYKREQDLPQEQWRAFSRVAAMLEIADDEFDRLQELGERREKDVAEGRDGAADELDAVSLLAYLKTSPVLRELTHIAETSGMDVDNETPTAESVSLAVALAKRHRHHTVASLDARLSALLPDAGDYLLGITSGAAEDGVGWYVTPAFLVALLLAAGDASLTDLDLEDLGLHPDLAEIVSSRAEMWRMDRLNNLGSHRTSSPGALPRS